MYGEVKQVIIDHNETFKEFGGKGYGKQLVLKGIEYAKEKFVDDFVDAWVKVMNLDRFDLK